eukprot:COSAG04_NODE_1141_length_8089_cov_510.847935_2_plen_412_part_00
MNRMAGRGGGAGARGQGRGNKKPGCSPRCCLTRSHSCYFFHWPEPATSNFKKQPKTAVSPFRRRRGQVWWRRKQTTAAIAGCRSTQLFQYANSVADSDGQQTTAVGGRGVFKKQWLTDYNCDSGDTGGLPGYPLAPLAADGTTALAGYCTDGVQTTQANCELLANGYCTVAGSCDAPATATVSGECGTCSVSDRFTDGECVKDADNSGAADGTWTAATWTAASAGGSFGDPCGGGGSAGVWKQRTWVPLPAGDATTAWRPVLAAEAASAAATAVDSATAPKTLTVTVAASYAVGQRVKVVVGTSGCGLVGTYTVASITSTTAITFTETMPAVSATNANPGVTDCKIERDAVTLGTQNKQCCSCQPATGSTVTAAALAVHETEAACTTDHAGARLGGTWVCAGVGPYCTVDA